MRKYNEITYYYIKETIKDYINSAFINKNYWRFVPILINEADYEYANVKDKKCVDDIAVEIIYIEPKKNEINRSLQYNLIKKYSEEEIIKINSSYEADMQKYKKF